MIRSCRAAAPSARRIHSTSSLVAPRLVPLAAHHDAKVPSPPLASVNVSLPRAHRPASLRIPHRNHVAALSTATVPTSSTTSHAAAVPPSTTTPKSTPPSPLPAKVLVANRGEIACRVMRTCRRLGIATVAVFSEADRNAMHVKMADEAYCIGPAPSAESYLVMDRIVAAAKMSGAQMIHPGYGFLSENATFSELLASSGIKFIGPPAPAIVAMGSKSASKDIMLRAGVPCVPGYHGADQSEETLLREADRVGYPVLIKAVKGGGGKGMKIVRKRDEFREQLGSARREAEKSFGDGDVLIERYLERPRHVEVQVVSSSERWNQHLAVSTRDCSVQRRHQKIIEEAPAPGLSDALLADLNHKATEAARAVGYEGAGTVEFIMDADTGEFFFMEMNTRLQVEHPVSEMITGIDLVEWQLNVAAGNPLPMTQEQIPSVGHSFESRIYAEDTRAGFLPDVGHLSYVAFPAATATSDEAHPSALPADVVASGGGEVRRVRVDTGVASGDEVSVHYDPMIAKLVVHGADRGDALRLMRHALEATQVVGPKTNVEFLKRLCRHEAFVSAEGLETGFISKFGHELHPPIEKPSAATLAQAALYLYLDSATPPASAAPQLHASPQLAHFRMTSAQTPSRRFGFLQRVADAPSAESSEGEREFDVEVRPKSAHDATTRFDVVVSEVETSTDPTASSSQSTQDKKTKDASQPPPRRLRELARFEDAEARLSPDGTPSVETTGLVEASRADRTLPSPRHRTTIVARAAPATLAARCEARLDVFAAPAASSAPSSTSDVGVGAGVGGQTELLVKAPTWLQELRGAKATAKGSVVSPMPSKVVDVRVAVGSEVQEGDVVVVLEAMKTEHVLRAPRSGTVARLAASQGSMVAEGVELVTFVDEEDRTAAAA